MIHKAFKYRIYPTEEQEILLAKHFGCQRFIYNYYLSMKAEEYKITKKSSNFNACCKHLTLLKNTEDHKWLYDVNSQSLVASINHLTVAYENFYKNPGKFKYPKFKKKYDKQSFKCTQHTEVEGNRLFIPKFKEGIPIILHRPYEGRIMGATVSKTSTGKYFVSLTCELEKIDPKPVVAKQIGIDLGLKEFMVASDGTRIENPKFYRNNENKIKYLNRQLSKKQPTSNRRKDAKLKLARIHEFINNSRTNFLHQLSAKLINENQVICLEDLNVEGMKQNHCLSKSVSDVSWSEFTRQLEYKGGWAGRDVVNIDRFYPSSKTCNHCGYINDSLTLDDRTWTCNGCGKEIDRDFNASQNICTEGLKQLSGCGTQSDIKQKLAEPTKKRVYRNKKLKDDIGGCETRYTMWFTKHPR